MSPPSTRVRGPLTRVDADEVPAVDERSPDHAPLRVFGESIDDLEPVGVRLDIDEITGRRTGD